MKYKAQIITKIARHYSKFAIPKRRCDFIEKKVIAFNENSILIIFRNLGTP